MRRRGDMLRRFATWAAVVVLAASAAGWIASMFRPNIALARPRWTRLSLREGGVEIQRSVMPRKSYWTGYCGLYHSWWPSARLKKSPIVVDMSRLTMQTGVTGFVFVPLWIPVAASCGALALTRFVWHGVPPGHCSSCAYDLTGITGPCPECGRLSCAGDTIEAGAISR